MTDRPYFRHGVEELERLFAAVQNDSVLLGMLRRELGHRTVPRARALTAQVDEALAKYVRPRAVPTVQRSNDQQLRVGCSQCGRVNSVAARNGAQHLSCAACLRPFVVEFESGIIKVTFPVEPAISGSRIWGVVVLVGVLLAGLYLFLRARS